MKFQRITPCLWFDTEAEAAANFYVGIFKNSKITTTSYFPEAGQEIHGKPAGSVMVVAFELDGHTFTALNGGPVFKFNEALSMQVNCEDQAEIDYFWDRLSVGGDENAQQCGWLKDKYGLSWQIVPTIMADLFVNAPAGKAQKAMTAMMSMKKLDIASLQKAAA